MIHESFAGFGAFCVLAALILGCCFVAERNQKTAEKVLLAQIILVAIGLSLVFIVLIDQHTGIFKI